MPPLDKDAVVKRLPVLFSAIALLAVTVRPCALIAPLWPIDPPLLKARLPPMLAPEIVRLVAS